MNEDEIVNNQVKRALEEGFSIHPDVLRSIESVAAREVRAKRWRRWRLPEALLVAASLTVILMWRVVSVSNDQNYLAPSLPDDLSEVRDAVNLMCAVDGIDEDIASFPADEMLLAWQDAPCADLL